MGFSDKGYTGYREELGVKDDIGGPNQANLGALAFILWCSKSISPLHYVCKFGSIQFQKQQERLADMFPLTTSPWTSCWVDKFLGRHVPG